MMVGHKSRCARAGHRLCQSLFGISNRRIVMGIEDVAAGKAKQIRGKANDIAGAVKGDTAQQIKGKAQKVVGKAQEAMGRESSKKHDSD
jgi:uncharacterized protein YjbJ (UPF0337 family)